MKYRNLGKTDLQVSEIGFGCWALGGTWWGKVDEESALSAVRKAAEIGINLFDTAPVYGFGVSEQRLAKALGSRRHDVVIATKCGLEWDDRGHIRANNSRKRIFKEVEDSLRRLEIDVIDLYQIHWPDADTPIGETVEALLELQEREKVKHIACCNFDADLLDAASEYGRLDSLQPPYNLFQREIEKREIPYCERHQLAILAYEPMARGLLSGKFKGDETFEQGDLRRNDPRFQGDRFRRNVKIVKLLSEIAKENSLTSSQLAVAWALSHPAVTSALCGSKKPEQIEECAAAAGIRLSEGAGARIEEVIGEEDRNQRG